MGKSLFFLILFVFLSTPGAGTAGYAAGSLAASKDVRHTNTNVKTESSSNSVDIEKGKPAEKEEAKAAISADKAEPGLEKGETDSQSIEKTGESCITYVPLLIFTLILLGGWILLAQSGFPGRKKEENDGEDPRDTPPPTLYGEELTPLKEPPVYVVSDFHIGNSNKISNDMKEDTLKKFIEWLAYVDNDASGHDHYDVVMNGDFFDLWQAAGDDDEEDSTPFDNILNSNKKFMDDFAGMFQSNGKMRFYYLIGNHDDGFKFEGSLRPRLAKILREKSGKDILPFAAQEAYSNTFYKLYAEHGHQHDSMNLKDDEDPCAGQEISEKFVNKMQEMEFANWVNAPGDLRQTLWPFENMELTPNKEMAKYFRCLKRRTRPATPQEVKEKIEEFEDFVTGQATADFITSPSWKRTKILVDYIINGDRAILDELDPENINEDEREAAKEKMDELNDGGNGDRVRIVLFGHTHIKDIHPVGGPVPSAYANTGTWLRKIKYRQDYFRGCLLKAQPSDLPFIKVSAYESQSTNKKFAFMELKTFANHGLSGSVLVDLD